MLSTLLLAVSLAMDAFAVSISCGVAEKRFSLRTALRVGLYFGGFQFLMPLAGWIFGRGLSYYIEAMAQTAAGLLLMLIGVNMVRQCLKGDEAPAGLGTGKLVSLALATSIDAMAAGIGLAFLSRDILQTALIIGLTAFVFSFFGVLMGSRLSGLFKNRAGIAGGSILLLLALRVLIYGQF